MPDTPPSLLVRLRDRGDHLGWQRFFEQYWRLIHSFARSCGLSADDAEDVVQEVVTEVFKAVPTFAYDRSKGTFRAFLRTITQHKITDHLRRTARGPAAHTVPLVADSADPRAQNDQTDAAGARRRAARADGRRAPDMTPDPADSLAEQVWERDWRRNLLQACLGRVREEVEPKTFQAFQLYALDGWSAKETAEFLGLNAASVYAAKSRVAERVRHWWDKEVGED